MWWAHLNRKVAAAEWLFISKAARSSHSLLQPWTVCKRQFSGEHSVFRCVPTTSIAAVLPHSLSYSENVCEHTHMWAALAYGYRTCRGRDANALLLLPHPLRDGDRNDFHCRSTPQRQLRWAMKGKQCGSPAEQREMLWYTARQNRFLKIKEKDSRGPFLPLVVVDSPKHWVWRGFWSLEFDARLIHRLLRVCTRWPRVNEHKLITFAHQGNVQLNLICTLQLKIFEYFSGAFYWDKMALQESIKRTETNQQITAAIFHTLISQLSDHSLTEIKVICYELYRNDGPIPPSYPSPLQPLCSAPR